MSPEIPATITTYFSSSLDTFSNHSTIQNKTTCKTNSLLKKERLSKEYYLVRGGRQTKTKKILVWKSYQENGYQDDDDVNISLH